MDDLKFYADVCTTFCKYELERAKSGKDALFSDDKGIKFLTEDSKRVIEEVNKFYERKKASKLKYYFQCFYESISEDPEFISLYDSYFLEKYGRSLRQEDVKRRKRIDTILKRGKIKNDSEFYLVKDFIDVFISECADDSVVSKLDSLLFEYEMKK